MSVYPILYAVAGVLAYVLILWVSMKIKRRKRAKKGLEDNEYFLRFK